MPSTTNMAPPTSRKDHSAQHKKQEQHEQCPEPAAPSAAGASRPKAAGSTAAARRRRQQLTYLALAAVTAVGLVALTAVATWLRLTQQRQAAAAAAAGAAGAAAVPLWLEATTVGLALAVALLGMESWACWAHRRLWHHTGAGWALHHSHHSPRKGAFEANDLYALVNGVPATVLCAWGFHTPGLLGAACFGAGLGITLYGMIYMFVHDGLIHRRFPVGPLAGVPALQCIAAAHQVHHSGKLGGLPWGLFLGPQELAAVAGGEQELARQLAQLRL